MDLIPMYCSARRSQAMVATTPGWHRPPPRDGARPFLKTSRISRSCNLSRLHQEMSAGGRQSAPVYRSTLETIDATSRCETPPPTQLETAATLPFGAGGNKRTSPGGGTSPTHAAKRWGYFWCIAILLLLLVDGRAARSFR